MSDSTDAATPTPSTEPAQPWYVRNRMRSLLLMFLGVMVFGAIVFTIVLLIFVSKVKSSEPYAMALDQVRQNPELQQRLGRPIEPQWRAAGVIDDADGYAELTFRVEGPNGHATIRAVAEHGDAQAWRLVWLQTAVFSQFGVEVIDIIDEKPPAGPPMPEPTEAAKERYGIE